MKIFILLIAIINFVINRHLSYKRGPQLLLDCQRDCFYSFGTNTCVAIGARLCNNYLNNLNCQKHRAVCKWRNNTCVVKQNACDNRCIQVAINSPDCMRRSH